MASTWRGASSAHASMMSPMRKTDHAPSSSATPTSSQCVNSSNSATTSRYSPRRQPANASAGSPEIWLKDTRPQPRDRSERPALNQRLRSVQLADEDSPPVGAVEPLAGFGAQGRGPGQHGQADRRDGGGVG